MSSTPVSAITDRQATASQSGRKDSPTLSRMQSACVLSTILTPKSPPRGDKSATIATVSQTPVESGKHLTPSMRQIASSAVSKTLNMHPTTVTPQKTGRATTSIDTTSGGSSVGKLRAPFHHLQLAGRVQTPLILLVLLSLSLKVAKALLIL
ncbi:hypothetical protein BC829DRAFT_215475 [Chytridium lagenaria]|nr:hypothetical protein BC829DRAFT_215475 [Chytridium lagenaria]